MSRYSTTKPRVKKPVALNPESDLMLNKAGGVAIELPFKEQLVSLALTSFMKDKYYETADETEARLRELVAKDPYFAAQVALYARRDVGMRSVTHVIATEVVKQVKGEAWTRAFVSKVVDRVDDMTEILALYILRNGRQGIPNSLKRGLASAFPRFDTYQLSKYRGEKKEVSLVDVVNLVHPKPTEKNKDALNALVNGTLRSENTWEVKVSAAGQKAKTVEEKKEAKEEAWSSLVASGKLGYLALLRNLRNLETLDAVTLKIALEQLVDPAQIKKSRTFPFQFATAYEHVGSRQVRTALSKAAEISLSNIPEFDGPSLVVVDHSGSMGDGFSSPKFIGDLFGVALWKKNPQADIIAFGRDAQYVKLDDDSGLFANAEKAGRVDVGHSTNLSAAFKIAKKPYSRVIIFSDMQTWVNNDVPESDYSYYYEGTNATKAFKAYCAKYDVNPYVYIFDLAGYGNTQDLASRQEGKVINLSGFSSKVFDVIDKSEINPRALVEEIEKIVI